MAFTFDSSFPFNASGTTATATPAATLGSGLLLVVGIVANDAGDITANADSGGAWTRRVNAAPASETAQVAIFEKVTNGSEPASYTFDLGSSRAHGGVAFIMSAENTITFQLATAVSRTTNTSVDIGIPGHNGTVFPANSVAIAVGGKDNIGSAEDYTVADNSYVGAIGSVNANRICAGAYRIYGAGETGVGDLRLTTTDTDDGVTDFSFGAIVVYTDEGGADVTAPVLSNITVTDIQEGSVDVGVDTDENGGQFIIRIYNDGDTPTRDDVVDGTGPTAFSVPVSITTPAIGTNVVVNDTGGFSASTTYLAAVVHVDAAGNRSNLQSLSFTTSASADVTPPDESSAADPTVAFPSAVVTRSLQIDEPGTGLIAVYAQGSTAPADGSAVAAATPGSGGCVAVGSAAMLANTPTDIVSGSFTPQVVDVYSTARDAASNYDIVKSFLNRDYTVGASGSTGATAEERLHQFVTGDLP